MLNLRLRVKIDAPMKPEPQQSSMKRRPLRNHAFTFVELLVVVVIIAIISALAIPAFNRSMSAARTSGCMSDLRQVHAAMMAYAGDHGGRLPMPWNNLDRFSWEHALARPSDGGIYLPPDSIHPGGNRKGNIRRLLFNREIAAMGGDPRGVDPNFTRSNYHMNHEFNLSFPGMRPLQPETMHRLAAFEWPSKTMLLMSGWAMGYRMPHKLEHRGDLDWERGPAFIHNGNKAIVLYAGGNIGLLTKEQVPIDPATKEWREFWLPTVSGSIWD